MSELRKDPLRAHWVAIATERVLPLALFRHPESPDGTTSCAFCPGHEHETAPELLAYRSRPGEAPNGPGWRVRVMPARFPALRTEGELERHGSGLYDLMNGIGAHEVIVESPDHAQDFGALSVADLENVLFAYRDRIMEVRRDSRLRAALIFKRHRGGAGGTREHAHSQLLATPVVPAALGQEMDQARVYYEYRERCLLCDVVRQELDVADRIVATGEHVVALAPFASRTPFEVWLLPRRHGAAFETAWTAEHRDTAKILHDVLRRLRQVLNDPPFSLVLHSAPFGESDSPLFHWHIEIAPDRTSGHQLRSIDGLLENPLPPEDAARALRAAAG